MQNLTECARRHHTISIKLIKPALRCCTGKRSDSSKTFTSSTCKSWMNRLFNPVLLHGPQGVSKDLQVISSFLANNSFISPHCTFGVPGLHSVRYFHTSGGSGYPRQAKKDDDKKPEQNDESDKDKKSGSGKNNKTEQEMVPVLIHLLLLVGASLAAVSLLRSFTNTEGAENMLTVSWNEFVHQMLAKGEVSRIIINNDNNTIKIVLQDGAVVFNKKHLLKTVYMIVPDVKKTEDKIRQAEDALGIPYSQRVPITYERVTERAKFVVNMVVAAALVMMMVSFASRAGNFLKEIRKMHPGSPKFTLVEPTTGKDIKFSDVAGLKEAKVEVMEFVDYLKNPERYRVLGAKIPKGVLLLGPPGCGKTMLAKALATESNVPFFSMNGCEFIEVYGGLGAARVRNLFKEAKTRAPSIIYIDEIDAFGQVRATTTQSSNNESERTLVQLLVEMDGMSTRDDVVILASTNRANVLDKALLRPGRFDRHILIDVPTQIERKEIFDRHLASLSLHKSPAAYSEYLASLTPCFTGADIANVCNEAALHAARLGKKKIFGSDLMYAIERTRCGPSKSTNAMSPLERKIIAYREAGFALLTWMLKHTDPVAKITIVPTTSGSLGNTQILEALAVTIPMNKIEDVTCATIGSRITETLVFGYATDATRVHLKKVTDLVTKQVAQFGMSPAIGLLSFEPDRFQTEGRPFSKKLSSIMDIEVRRIIMEAGNRAEAMLIKHRKLLNALAEELLRKETLYYEDIERLIGAPPYPKKRPQIPASFMTDEENSAESGR